MSDLTILATDYLEKDAVSAKRRKLEKIVDDLLKLKPGPERWQEALRMYVKLNLSSTDGMTAAEEVYYTIQENKQARADMKNAYGKSNDKNSDMRYQLHMPAGFKTLLNLVDPRINSKDNLPLIRKTFPMFTVSERF